MSSFFKALKFAKEKPMGCSFAFALSLAIELTQMFGLGITDVNDLMTNTAGACLGLFLYRAVWKRKNAEQKTKL